MPRDEDWEQRRQYLIRSMFVQAPAVSPVPELHESLELDVDNFELTVEHTSRRPDDDEPEEFYEQLEKNISNYKETSDIDEEKMEEEKKDIQQEKDSESSESFCFSVRPERNHVHQENKSENTDGRNENDLKRALSKPTKAQLKLYEDNRDDDYLKAASSGSSSGDLDQRRKIQDTETPDWLVEIEAIRSHNTSPAADSFHREVGRNSSTSTVQRSSLNVKQSLVGDHDISADFLVTPEGIIMSNESREEIHLLVTTPPLWSSAKRTASHPASEAPPSKRNVGIQNVRETVDVGVQTEQKTETTETQTYSEERYQFRSWGVYSSASKRIASHSDSEAPPSRRNVGIQNVRETVDVGVQTEQKTRTTETQTYSEERNLFRSWGVNASMHSCFWFN